VAYGLQLYQWADGDPLLEVQSTGQLLAVRIASFGRVDDLHQDIARGIQLLQDVYGLAKASGDPSARSSSMTSLWLNRSIFASSPRCCAAGASRQLQHSHLPIGWQTAMPAF